MLTMNTLKHVDDPKNFLSNMTFICKKKHCMINVVPSKGSGRDKSSVSQPMCYN